MLAWLHDIRSGISLNFNENKTEFIVYGPSVSKGIINLNLANLVHCIKPSVDKHGSYLVLPLSLTNKYVNHAFMSL